MLHHISYITTEVIEVEAVKVYTWSGEYKVSNLRLFLFALILEETNTSIHINEKFPFDCIEIEDNVVGKLK